MVFSIEPTASGSWTYRHSNDNPNSCTYSDADSDFGVYDKANALTYTHSYGHANGYADTYDHAAANYHSTTCTGAGARWVKDGLRL